MLGGLVLLRSARAIISTFHWAEKRVDRSSPWHMVLAFAVTLPFNLGVPIPIVHQAWAVAIGCFFRWNAFPILLAALSVGVPVPFVLGRQLAAGGDTAMMEARLRWVAPSAVAYLSPLRQAIASRPVRSAFLLMWAPLPTPFLPLLLGFLFTSVELPLRAFVSGALPSKLLHFGCDVLVGLQGGSLAAALDAHDELPGADDLAGDNTELARSRRKARCIAIGVMTLAVLFMVAMLHTMHSALKEMKTCQASGELQTEDLDKEQGDTRHRGGDRPHDALYGTSPV